MQNFNNNYNPYGESSYQGYGVQGIENKVSAVMKTVYLKMFFALLVTAAVSAGIVVMAPQISVYIGTHTGVYIVAAIIEVGLVIAISGAINRMSSTTASLLFYLFAIVNGVTLSLIGLVYSPVSILKTFIITAGTFGAMSIYGYFTNKNLAKMGSILMMALFGLIICMIVNIFWANSTFDWIISGLGVLIFVGLTAWDTQQIKNMAQAMPNASDGRLATLGALTLYLDFVNLFLYLLRFFGNRD
ncbi:MAG: Bax inhibitor-1/YccA family protein [Bacteroides sp.]|nr:Bax inhibitor-1/YccA family protein [Bacteroides sp.]MDE6225633.1 Bax inhibitor-1/YccA family protein [Muribaculaceae bacterium]